MSTIGIVALSLIGGMFILLLLISAGLLVYHSYQTRRLTLALTAQIADFSKSLTTTLESHRTEMSRAIASINGEGLIAASRLITNSAKQIVPAVLALDEIVKLLVAEQRAPSTNLADEQFGPDEQGTILQSRPARLDDLAQAADNDEVTE